MPQLMCQSLKQLLGTINLVSINQNHDTIGAAFGRMAASLCDKSCPKRNLVQDILESGAVRENIVEFVDQKDQRTIEIHPLCQTIGTFDLYFATNGLMTIAKLPQETQCAGQIPGPTRSVKDDIVDYKIDCRVQG